MGDSSKLGSPQRRARPAVPHTTQWPARPPRLGKPRQFLRHRGGRKRCRRMGGKKQWVPILNCNASMFKLVVLLVCPNGGYPVKVWVWSRLCTRLTDFVGDFNSQQTVALGSIFVGEGQDWLLLPPSFWGRIDILFHLASEHPVKKDTV